jgi:hypothetical protein
VTSGSAGSRQNSVAAINSRWKTAIQTSHGVFLCPCSIITGGGHVLQGCGSGNLDTGVKYLCPLCIQQNLQRINAPYICENVWSSSHWYMYQPWERQFHQTSCWHCPLLHNTRTSVVTHNITRWGESTVTLKVHTGFNRFLQLSLKLWVWGNSVGSNRGVTVNGIWKYSRTKLRAGRNWNGATFTDPRDSSDASVPF